jgi:hypothetical protein
MPHTNRKRPFPYFLWHRRLGLISLLLVIVLAITGIMLNHTESLKLDETHIESDALLNWYGLNPKGHPISYAVSEHVISQWNNQLFFNNNALMSSSEKLYGAVASHDMLIIALESTLLLIDSSGELIEKLDNFSAIKNIRGIGLIDQHVAVKTDRNKIFIADTDIVSWKEIELVPAQWQQAISLNSKQIQQLKQAYRGQGLTLERVVLDLHSGRIFNANWGIYLMDASAIIMILLGISGTWVWWSRNQKMKRKRHYKKHHKNN